MEYSKIFEIGAWVVISLLIFLELFLVVFLVKLRNIDKKMDIDKEPPHQTKRANETIIEEQRCIVKTLLSFASEFVFTKKKNENDEALRMVVSKCPKTNTEINTESIFEITITLENSKLIVLEQYPVKDIDLVIERIMYFCDKYYFPFNRSKDDSSGT